MAIEIRAAATGPLKQINVSAPNGAVIGIVGESGSGVKELLQAAGGRYLGPVDRLDFSSVPVLALDHTLAFCDALEQAGAAARIEMLRRAGSTILLASHDMELLRLLADEVWWIDRGELRSKGDPLEVLDAYREHIAVRRREEGRQNSVALAAAIRRGDGRAEILAIETLGEDDRPAIVVRSGERMTIRVRVKFHAAVEDPVVGIMIRTRIGSEVYGTNTELERLRLGPVSAGQTVAVAYRFACHLCPQEYAITAASHDPNGVWHDWMEDALAFSVTDSRYTAGVANLRAQASVE